METFGRKVAKAMIREIEKQELEQARNEWKQMSSLVCIISNQAAYFCNKIEMCVDLIKTDSLDIEECRKEAFENLDNLNENLMKYFCIVNDSTFLDTEVKDKLNNYYFHVCNLCFSYHSDFQNHCGLLLLGCESYFNLTQKLDDNILNNTMLLIKRNLKEINAKLKG